MNSSLAKTKILLAGSYWLVVLVILRAIYPVADYYPSAVVTIQQAAIVYFEMACYIWVPAMLVWLTAAKFFRRRIVAAGIAFALLTVILFSFSIFQLNGPPIRELMMPVNVRSHFFREYMPIAFAEVTGPICSAVLAIVVAIDGKKDVHQAGRMLTES